MTGLLSRLFPIAAVVAAIMIVWYGFTVHLNSPWQIERYEKADIEWKMEDLVRDTMAQERPVLPAPHQIVREIWKTTVEKKITSKRSLIFHGGVTLSSTLLGFAMGTILGIGLAVKQSNLGPCPPAGGCIGQRRLRRCRPSKGSWSQGAPPSARRGGPDYEPPSRSR